MKITRLMIVAQNSFMLVRISGAFYNCGFLVMRFQFYEYGRPVEDMNQNDESEIT